MAAIALVLLADRAVFSTAAFWTWANERLAEEAPERGFERGLVQAQSNLIELRDHENPLIALVGSSRANASFNRRFFEEHYQPGIEIARFAHGGMRAYEIFDSSFEFLTLEPDVVLLLLSEFDTHSHLILQRQTAPGSLRALFELTGILSFGEILEFRHEILQLAVAGLLDSFRYRQLLHTLGVGIPVSTRSVKPLRRPQPGAPVPRRLDPAVRQEILQAAQDSQQEQHMVKQQIGYHLRLGAQRSTRVKMEMLRRLVERARAGGSRVVIMEGALSPLAYRLFDRSLRDEFLVFARELESLPGVSFIPLEDTGPFVLDDFSDLNHLKAARAKVLAATLFEILDPIVGHSPQPPSADNR